MNLEETPAEPVEGRWRCTRCDHVYEVAGTWQRGIDPRYRYGRCYLGTSRCRQLKTPATFVRIDERNLSEGRTRRRAGMNAATAASGSPWVSAFDGALKRLAAGGEPFTSEDVTAIAGQPPSSGAVGARMAAAARRGLIVAIGHRAAERPNQHATEIKVWRGSNA